MGARRAPIILGVLAEHPLFWECSPSTHYFGSARRAPITQRGTSTHCSKTTKQRASEQMQNGHERNKFMKCSLEKMRARTHYFWGLEHPSFWGLEHSFSRRAWALTIQRAVKWRTSEQLQNEHGRNRFMKCSLEKMSAHTHYFWGLEHPLFWGLEHPFF
jgi:hypothetical protein